MQTALTWLLEQLKEEGRQDLIIGYRAKNREYQRGLAEKQRKRMAKLNTWRRENVDKNGRLKILQQQETCEGGEWENEIYQPCRSKETRQYSSQSGILLAWYCDKHVPNWAKKEEQQEGASDGQI